MITINQNSAFFLRNYYPISILFFFLCTNITKPISSNCLIQNVAYTYTNTFLLYIVRFSRDLYHSANASQRIMATTNISHEKCHICFLATSYTLLRTVCLVFVYETMAQRNPLTVKRLQYVLRYFVYLHVYLSLGWTYRMLYL